MVIEGFIAYAWIAALVYLGALCVKTMTVWDRVSGRFRHRWSRMIAESGAIIGAFLGITVLLIATAQLLLFSFGDDGGVIGDMARDESLLAVYVQFNTVLTISVGTLIYANLHGLYYFAGRLKNVRVCTFIQGEISQEKRLLSVIGTWMVTSLIYASFIA